MNECECGTRISYAPPCTVCARRLEAEYLEVKPVDPDQPPGLSPRDPRFFNTPTVGKPEDY